MVSTLSLFSRILISILFVFIVKTGCSQRHKVEEYDNYKNFTLGIPDTAGDTLLYPLKMNIPFKHDNYGFGSANNLIIKIPSTYTKRQLKDSVFEEIKRWVDKGEIDKKKLK